MFGGSDILWVSAAILAVSAASLTGLGHLQRRYRGYDCWVVTLWVATAGAALTALFQDQPVAIAIGAALLAQWPIGTLIGLRRFHGRLHLPGSARMDLTIGALCMLTAASAPLWPVDHSLGSLLPAVSTLLVHLYVASLLAGGSDGREGFAMRLLAVALVVAGMVPLLVSGPGADVTQTAALRSTLAGLGAIVTAFVGLTLMHERTERQLRDSRRRLRVLANMDALTNVPNRRHFEELAARALRNDDPGSATLLLFDIDHFKQINDHLGHAAGDRALRLVSRAMTEHLRVQDIAGRHGGDEFVLMLRHTEVRDAMAVASRIVAWIQRQTDEARLPPLSLSFGIVQLQPAEALDEALRRADLALYEAKRQGRSCAVAQLGDEERPVFSESQRLGLTEV